jgi:hypothetical protein
MARLINRIQRAILGGANAQTLRALLIELAIPFGGSGPDALRDVRHSILHPMDEEAELRTGIGTGDRPMPRLRAAILRNLIDSETTLRDALNDLLAPADLSGAGTPPTDIIWAGIHSIAEGIALGTQIGGMLSSNEAVGFSLVNDGGGLFGIGADGTSIIVTGVPDYETATSHNIIIRATDAGGLTYDETFAITVTDVDESPPDLPADEGEIIVANPGTFETPPTVVAVDDALAVQGKKKGAAGKFIFDIGIPQPGQTYTMQYDPDWSLLENGGITAMVGFGLLHNNDFRLSGLKGDGSSGLKAYEYFGVNKWNKTTGFQTNDGGLAAHGTQDGPNWLQFTIAADGSTYTLKSSADGIDWVNEFTDLMPSPFTNIVQADTFGIAVFLDINDDGPFRIDITLWQAGEWTGPPMRQAMLYGVYVNFDDVRDGYLADGIFLNAA